MNKLKQTLTAVSVSLLFLSAHNAQARENEWTTGLSAGGITKFDYCAAVLQQLSGGSRTVGDINFSNASGCDRPYFYLGIPVRYWLNERNAIELAAGWGAGGEVDIDGSVAWWCNSCAYSAESSYTDYILAFEHRLPMSGIDWLLKVGYQAISIKVKLTDHYVSGDYSSVYASETLPSIKSSGPLWGLGLAFTEEVRIGYENKIYKDELIGNSHTIYLAVDL